jgi:hypothetical protein
MSDPLSEKCLYCGAPDVLDDAWWCHRRECWAEYEREAEEKMKARRANYVCPVCGQQMPSADMLCSGSFLNENHPPNVVPVAAHPAGDSSDRGVECPDYPGHEEAT